MGTVAGAVGGAVVLSAPSFAMCSAPAPVSTALHGSTFSSASTSHSSNLNLCRNGLLLSLGRRRRGGRFKAARARNGDEADNSRDAEPNQEGEQRSVDWDKAWSSFSKPQKKKGFLTLNMEKYVSRRPNHPDYPLSEEVDPLRKSERAALGPWTSIKFTYALVFVIIGLAVFMVLVVGPPPRH